MASYPNRTLPTVDGAVFARMLSLRVGSVARFSVAPFGKGSYPGMGESVSALMRVKLTTVSDDVVWSTTVKLCVFAVPRVPPAEACVYGVAVTLWVPSDGVQAV